MKQTGTAFGIIALLFLFSSTAFAQDFLTTTKGDTLYGKIKLFNYGSDRKVQVQENGKKKAYYGILQVHTVRVDNESYQPVKGPLGYTFMKLIKDGYVSLYNYQLQNQVTYDGLFLTKKDGTSLDVPNLTFKKALKKFLSECPSTVAKVEDGTYAKKDLVILVEDYNNCVAERALASNESLRQTQVAHKKSGTWEALEQAVTSKPDFEGKSDALEMIGEIKVKVSRKEKVPNFLIEGLKSALKDTDLTTQLDAAIQELNNP